ncbi:unnamed protein product [Phytomonas sp. Hart1]|nr:unnamed protein product [Phytomonas sp. Hart1]|eukprot:CCW70732.1 unnamed protein product [Phytomonas sp. isolate Hart1]
MWRLCRGLRRGDPLNAGSSMTLGSKGAKHSPGPQRARMPWTAAKEYVPGVVLHAKDRALLDGAQLVGLEALERAAQVDPLAALHAAVASYRYHTSTGQTLFQLAAGLPSQGRGQRFFRPEWKEGTADKHVVLAGIAFDRAGHGGRADGYVCFHGESTTRPGPIPHADVPGWAVDFDAAAEAPPEAPLPPPPSVGVEVPVDPRRYRLRAYPFYDAPNPPGFVERLLKDRGVVPDLTTDAAEAGDAIRRPADAAEDGSIPYERGG